MTRINVIDPKELHNKHLMGEIHEITRVYGLVRKAKERGVNKYNISTKLKIPPEYTLGTGHVLFFYNKLGFITNRYNMLIDEAISRGFKPSRITVDALTEGIDAYWMGDYSPTEMAIQINRNRIKERLPVSRT